MGPGPAAHPGPLFEHDKVWVFSGASGRHLLTIDNPSLPRQVGGPASGRASACWVTGDVNGDGHDEIYGNGFRQHGEVGPNEGRACVLDGRTAHRFTPCATQHRRWAGSSGGPQR